jgi:excisionase family DNA binding protein
MSQKQAFDYSQWPTKDQVAAILDVSTKTVETLCKQGKLQSSFWRRPSGGPKITVYHPAEVESERRLRFPDAPSAFVMPALAPSGSSEKMVAEVSQRSGSDSQNAQNAILALLQAALGPRSQMLLETSGKASETSGKKPYTPVESRVYLTVREAATYLGWPEGQVRGAIAGGELAARKVGHTRVRRRDLDAL